MKTDNRDMTVEEERDFMRRIACGDKRAFSVIMGNYMNDIHRFAFSIVGDAALSEDITQETCLRLWNKAGTWNGTGRVKSWLFGVAHRLCIDGMRRRKDDAPLENVSYLLRDPAKDPLQRYSESQIARIVQDAMFLLPERQRAALMLVHGSGFTNIEAAEALEVSVDALESLLSRGRAKLKSRLSNMRKPLLEREL